MSRSTISTFKLFELIPDAETARKFLESKLWKDGPTCPKCKSNERVGQRKGGFYRCHSCKLDFTVRTGTIFERSHVPLHKWVYAMYLVVTARKGISSMQLAKEIGITQKSAWFVLQRLREACIGNSELLKGIVEVDEVYLGGKEQNKHMRQRMYGDRGSVAPKVVVIGMREKHGRIKAKHVIGSGAISLQNAIRENVEQGSTLHTDEYGAYIGLRREYKHRTVNHSKDEYSKNGVTTNSVESAFALLRRGIHGTFHHISVAHVERYINEFTWRLNEGNVKRHSLERLDSFIAAITGKRITYSQLTA